MKKYLQMFNSKTIMSITDNEVAPWVGAEREHKTVDYRATIHTIEKEQEGDPEL